MKKSFYIVIALGIILSFGFTSEYPIDGYEATGIARLLRMERMERDSIMDNRLKPGSYLRSNDIKLNLLSRANDSFSVILNEDDDFENQFKSLLPGSGYSAAILDMSDSTNLRYADFRENVGYQPGSVGKLAVVTAIFNEIAKLCPDSWEQRVYYLKSTRVKARYWGTGDHHTVPIYDIENDKLTRRQVVASDEFTLYEWIDHMLSVSNNGAASVVWREALLMAGLGEKYFETNEEQAEEWFKETPRDSLTDLANKVVNQPLLDMGISKDEWRLGSFFTGAANKYVGDKGGSIGTPVGLMKYLVKLEQGQIVDERTSLEIKKLMYMTDKRIRYSYSKELDDAAVYFKSGSFYKCDRNKNPNCSAYAGNVFNYMNSVIIVEHPNGKKYIVCLMTNVLNKNSAGAHMYLATKIDNLINPSS